VKQERPLQFFSLSGLFLLLLGLALGTPVILTFLSTGLVPRLPTAVLATGCVLLSFLSFSVGLILESVAQGRKEMKRLAYLSIPAFAPAGLSFGQMGGQMGGHVGGHDPGTRQDRLSPVGALMVAEAASDEFPAPVILRQTDRAHSPAAAFDQARAATGGPPLAGPVDGKYYEVAKPASLAEKIAIRARDRIYTDFMRLCRPAAQDSVLDVGVSDVVGEAANVLERRYPYPQRITAVGLGSGEDFHAAYPAVTYRQIEANQKLPFDDGAIDIVTSNAVLEHVGSAEGQRRFVAELMRVGRRGFVTVPHRFFPVEHHTGIPLLHWTDLSFALACRLLGKQAWSQQDNLILMSRSRLRAACPAGVNVRVGATGLLLGPFSANLYLYWDRTCGD
jgi:hypothetical protein